MDILLENLFWMSFNIILAFAGVVFGYLMQSRHPVLKITFLILWLLFVPNTIYLSTDLIHLPEQVNQLGWSSRIILLTQYLVLTSLGVLTFLIAMRLFEKILPKKKDKSMQKLIIALTIYLIAFGVVLGRIHRTNSWDIFTAPQDVISSSMTLLNSPQTLLIIFLFGTLVNLIYFGLKSIIKIKKKRH